MVECHCRQIAAFAKGRYNEILTWHNALRLFPLQQNNFREENKEQHVSKRIKKKGS